MALAACAGNRAQVRPALDLPTGFSSTGQAPLPDRWWLAIDDPLLHRLIDEGLARNPSLLAVWDRLDQARAVMKREGASRYPTVDGSASAGASASRDSSGTSTNTSLSLGLAASYEVDLWGSIAAGRQAVALEERATVASVRAAAITLSSEIATTWFDLAEQRTQAALLAEQLARANQTLAIVQQRYDLGAIAETDVLRQRQQVESIQGDQTLTVSAIAVLEHRLAILLGHAPGHPIPISGELAALPALPATGVPAALIQRRPDVLQSFYQIQIADKNVAQAISERYPRLSLSLRASTSGALPQDLLTGFVSSLVGNLVQPLIDGGRRRAEVERSQAQLAERINGYRQVVLSALGEVEDSLARETQQSHYLVSLDAQIELATQVYERTQRAYQSGAVDYLRVLDAEDSLQSLQRRRLSAAHTLIAYRIALYRSLAGGWQMSRPAA